MEISAGTRETVMLIRCALFGLIALLTVPGCVSQNQMLDNA